MKRINMPNRLRNKFKLRNEPANAQRRPSLSRQLQSHQQRLSRVPKQQSLITTREQTSRLSLNEPCHRARRCRQQSRYRRRRPQSKPAAKLQRRKESLQMPHSSPRPRLTSGACCCPTSPAPPPALPSRNTAPPLPPGVALVCGRRASRDPVPAPCVSSSSSTRYSTEAVRSDPRSKADGTMLYLLRASNRYE